MRRDTQLVELAGIHWLMGQLLSFGIEVARPARDRGVDLLAYQERAGAFCAIPIQVKASSARAFSWDKKYLRCKGLIIVYVWDLRENAQPCAMALRQEEVLAIASDLGYTKNESWQNGKYSNTNPGERLRTRLVEYLSTQARWHGLLRGESKRLLEAGGTDLAFLCGPEPHPTRCH